LICDLCSKNDATVHLTEIINDQTRELHLCETCAREKGAAAAQQFGLAELLAGLSDLGSKPELKAALTSCSNCGLGYEDFRKSGRLGCDHCYETFRAVLAPLLKRIHGSSKYTGRLAPPTPRKTAGTSAKTTELAQLKEQLKQAVAAESFEEAVRLRDQIRTAEKKKKKKDDA